MAKLKKRSKVQQRNRVTVRGKARKATKSSQGKASKRTVARAKPKRAPVKKAARRMKRPVAPPVETVAVEHAAPEFEEVSKVSPGPDEPEE
jgi:hypothetical protein